MRSRIHVLSLSLSLSFSVLVRAMKQLFWLSALCLLVAGGNEAASSGGGGDGDGSEAKEDKLRLRIIHTNDMHSRFEEVSKEGGYCSEQEAAASLCYGGFARLASLVREARANASPSEPVFFLNAGDTYQGTELFSHYKASIVVRFLNMLRPDVASLGNHEFDDKVSGLVPYLNNASFPVVAANLDLRLEPELLNSKRLVKSHVLLAGGGGRRRPRKIGVIGYLTPETAYLSQPGRVLFLDEVASVREEARRLQTEEGCDIVVALGHSGYELDKRIAREVEQVDLVIGGHTNTFLYGSDRPPPDKELPEGPYPTVVLQPSGRKVYVVQAYAYTKYLGDLSLEFDARGEITRCEGSPVLVDARVPKAQDLEDELRKWLLPLRSLGARPVGSTRVLLDGDEKVCRLTECNFGNLLTDAMIHYNAKLYGGSIKWTDASIAIGQAGGIRSSINVMNDEKVTMTDILTSFPFATKMCQVRLPGKVLRSILEWSVHDRIDKNTTRHGGAFLQLSGLQVTYDLSKPVGSRVLSAKVRCSSCEVPSYDDLKPETTYTILANDFLYNGGDGFKMFQGFEYKDFDVTIADVVAQYINQTSPVYPGIEGRISFVEDDVPSGTAVLRLTTNSVTMHLQRASISLLILKSVAFLRFF